MRLGLLLIAMTILLGATGARATARPAHTAATCGGKLVASIPIKNKAKKRIGSLVLYRSGATTCAMTKHGGASWGKKRFTDIMLVGCKTAKAGKDCGEAPYKEDKGQFAYQAGPVRVKNGKHCVWARGYVGAPHDKPLFMAQTDGKYRGRFCG
jgi:hypothetical protein